MNVDFEAWAMKTPTTFNVISPWHPLNQDESGQQQNRCSSKQQMRCMYPNSKFIYSLFSLWDSSQSFFLNQGQAFLEPHRYYRRMCPHYSAFRALASQITPAIDCSVVLTWVTSPGFLLDWVGALVSLTGFNLDIWMQHRYCYQ